MDKIKLSKYLQDYKLFLKNASCSEEDALNERVQRIAYYQSFTKDKIQTMDRDELLKYIGKLWAAVVYGNKAYLVDKMIDTNGGLKN